MNNTPKTTFVLMIILVIISTISCKNDTPIINPISNIDSLGLIPQPQNIELNEGGFVFKKEVSFVFNDEADPRILNYLKTNFSINKVILKGEKPRLKNHNVHFTKITNDTLNKEAYFLDITADKIHIKAISNEGFYRALTTLKQLLPYNRTQLTLDTLPAISICDQPQFAWRGVHLDVCRHFFDKDFVLKYIDLMAKHKLNVFHWHLTEDQGWRIEIKKYPKLTTISSIRKETIVAKNFNPYVGDGIEYGGFYTQEEIKEVVAYAADRFITVVPEIEMPGHSVAALAAYPELSCTGGPFEVLTKWGVSENIYCAGNDSVFVFLQNIIDEVLELFPSKYIHIGGDEAPKSAWEKCDKCQARIKAEGLENEHELQSYFISRMEKYINSKGRQIIGWDEILEGGLAPNASVMSWRGESGGIDAANQGHYVVMTPGSPCYFDHYQSKDVKNEPLAIGGYNSLKAVYEYNPIPKELAVDKHKYILGSQANVWTEYIPTTKQVEYMTYPRLCALTEALWTGENKPGFDDFKIRLKLHYKRLDNWNVNYRKPKIGSVNL